jgi:hypothetical protein
MHIQTKDLSIKMESALAEKIDQLKTVEVKIYVYIRICIYIYTYVCIYIYINIHINVYTYIKDSSSKYMHICMYIYTHINVHTYIKAEKIDQLNVDKEKNEKLSVKIEEFRNNNEALKIEIESLTVEIGKQIKEYIYV